MSTYGWELRITLTSNFQVAETQTNKKFLPDFGLRRSEADAQNLSKSARMEV
jgi:hypothetical protein